MRVLGLTGGIATGKSTVSAMLAEAGVPVIDADLLARRVVEPGRPAHRALQHAFGPDFFRPDGTLDRDRMARLVFGDDKARRRLNACTHPYVRHEVIRELVACFFAGHALVVFDSALLIETRMHRFTYPLVVVDCAPATQLERVMARDRLSSDDARARIDAQLPLDAKRRLATVVVDNNGSRDETRAQVARILAKYQTSAAETALFYWVLFVPISLVWLLLQLFDLWWNR